MKQSDQYPFQELRESLLDSEPVSTRYLRFGSYTVEIRFFSSAAVSLYTPALAHRLILSDVAEADFVLLVGDSASTEFTQPEFPFKLSNLVAGGAIPLSEFPDQVLAYDVDSGLVQLVDHERKVGLVWARDSLSVQPNHRAAPFLYPLQWALSIEEKFIWHAAAVGYLDGAVLLAGPGGSGKSTSALAALGGGLDYLGDDYCLVSLGADGPIVETLYNSGKADEHSINLLRFLKEESAIAIDQIPYPKSLFYFFPKYSHQLPEKRSIRAVIMPEVSGLSEPQLEPLSGGKALLKLAPSTLFQLAHTGGEAFAFMGNVVRMLPRYRMLLANDPKLNTNSIQKLLTLQ